MTRLTLAEETYGPVILVTKASELRTYLRMDSLDPWLIIAAFP